MSESSIVAVVALPIVLAFVSSFGFVARAPYGVFFTLAFAAVAIVAFVIMNIWYAHWSMACPQCPVGSDDTRTTAWRAAALTVGVWLVLVLTALVAGGLVGRLLSAHVGMTHRSADEQP